MRKMVDTILRQHGTAMTVQSSGDGSSVTVRGFFQPVRSKSWQHAEFVATPLGEVSRGQYVYIGPASVAVNEGDGLQVSGRCFRFRRVEPYFYEEQEIYRWGLCVEEGGAAAWGSQS